MTQAGHSAAVTYGAPAWDVRWRRSIAYAMAELTEGFWQGNGQRRTWFFFGGCLFWLLLWWAAFAYIAAKVALWAAIEILLALALLGVLAAGGAWRGGRHLRHAAARVTAPITARGERRFR
jgi:hypothetical protein